LWLVLFGDSIHVQGRVNLLWHAQS
jgi:hypothetical protein